MADQLRGRAHHHRWAEESDGWPVVTRERRWTRPIAVAIVLAVLTGLALVAFAGGWLSRPDHRGKVEAR